LRGQESKVNVAQTNLHLESILTRGQTIEQTCRNVIGKAKTMLTEGIADKTVDRTIGKTIDTTAGTTNGVEVDHGRETKYIAKTAHLEGGTTATDDRLSFNLLTIINLRCRIPVAFLVSCRLWLE
jgi:hypothetical protein